MMRTIAIITLFCVAASGAPLRPQSPLAPINRRVSLPVAQPSPDPRDPSVGGPYPCIPGIIFVDGAPVLALICNGVPVTSLSGAAAEPGE